MADKKFRATLKESIIKIYSIDTVVVDGVQKNYKTYPYGSALSNGIHANVRYQSASERVNSGIDAGFTTLQIIINWRPNIAINQFIEYGGNTYQIVLPPDAYKMHKRELKITALSTVPLPYDEERYTE